MVRGGLKPIRGRIERQRRVRIAATRRGQILQPPEVESRVQHARRVGDHVEDLVALRPVVEDPGAAAHNRLSFTRQVVDRADARRGAEGVAVLELIVDPLAGLVAAVEPIRARREPADEALFNGVGQRRGRIGADQRRVHPAAHAAGARRAADAHRVIELRGIGLIELVRQEIRCLQRRVPLRCQIVEPHPVIERETVRRPPVVLHVPLDVLVVPFRNRELIGLLVEIEHARRRVRVGEARVEGVARVVLEVDLAVEAGEDALRLEAVLEIEPGLRGVCAPHFRQVGEDVVRDVLVGERAAVGLVLAGVARAPAAEDEPGHVVALGGAGKQKRQRRHARVRTEQLLLLELIVQRVLGASPAHFERRAVVQDAGRGQHVVRAGVHEQRRRRELVAAVAGPRRAIRLQDVFPVVHVAAGDPPTVRGLEVHAQQLFAALGAVRILAREVQAAAAGEIRRRENAERGQAGRIEPVLGNPAEDAAVLETAARVGRAARQSALVVTNVRVRVAAAVHAL